MKRQQELNPTESHLIYILDDNFRVTPLTIQQILNKTSKSDTQKGLKKAFDLLLNLRSFKSNPNDSALKQAIFQELQTLKSPQPQNAQSLNSFDAFRFDINKSYLMNKAGGIGMLERSCKFTEKGVLQFEQGKKQPKLKQIKGFKNIIEKFKDKQNLSKLQWVKQSAKFPFRIVLIDKNKADKAVYFQSYPQASAAQVYLIQKYNSKQPSEKVKGLFANLAQYRQNKMVQNFSVKFKPYAQNMKNQRKSYEKSRQKTNINMVEPNSSKQDNRSKYDNQSVFDKHKQRQSNTMSQYFFKEQRASTPMLIDDNRTQFNFKKTNKQSQSFGDNKKMVFPKVHIRKLNEKLKNYKDFCVQNLIELWKQKTANDPQKYNETNKLRQSNDRRSLFKFGNELFSGNQVEQRQKEEKQTVVLRFSSFELQINCFLPFKPFVIIQIINKNQEKSPTHETKELKFNTFKVINQKRDDRPGTIHYDLILEGNDQSGNQHQNLRNQVMITQNYSNHFMKFSLINLLTEDVIIYKQISLDQMKVQHQNFSFTFNQSSQNQPNILNPIQNNHPILKLIGTISNSNPKPNVKGLFDYLFLNIDSLTKISDRQQDPTDKLNDNQQHSKRAHKNQTIITLIPELDSDLKLQLHQIMQRKNYHLHDQFSYLPIQNLQDLSPSQQELTILSVTASLLRNKNLPPVSLRYLHILRMLIESNVFSSESQLVEGFISILMKWSGQLLNCNNDELNLAKVIGFEDDQIDKTSEKISVSLQLIQFLLMEECPMLVHKMNRRNIPLPYLCLEYCHNMLVKNFQPFCAVSILTQIFNSYDKSHEILLILTQVYLCKNLEQELLNCYKLEQVQFLLQNALRNPSNTQKFLIDSSLLTEIEKFIIQRWTKYFSDQNRDKYAKEFEKIRSKFYQIQGQKLRNKKQRRFAQKSSLTQRFSQLSAVKPPSYKPRSHCLHIFFVSVPKISGSLYLKTSFTEFQCTDYEKNPYFVISNLDSKVQLQFIDSKSNHYTFDLVFDSGFGFFKHQINQTNDSNLLKFQYWAGLFEESSIDYQYKNIKDIQSSLSSELTLKDLQYKLNKQFGDSKLMRAIQKVCFNNGKNDFSLQELERKIKTAFSEFQNKVNQYDLFLHLLVQRKVSLEEKLYILFQFSKSIQQELFLSENSSIDRIVLYDFLKIMDIPIKFRQFEALYQGILWRKTETEVPKVFKARFFFVYQEKRQVKLENELYSYIYQRAQKFLYTDIDIKEFLIYIKPTILAQVQEIETQIGRKIKLDEGFLKLVISSQGQVEHYLFKVNIKNNNREFIVEQQSLPHIPYEQRLNKAIPKVLYHNNSQEITYENQDHLQSELKLVSRFKSSPIKPPSLAESRINQLISQKSINPQPSDFSQFQKTNLCKLVMAKNRTIIRFRYKSYPKEVGFRNFNLFADLNVILFGIKQNKELHSVKQLFLNNREVNTIEFLNDFSRSYKFGVSQNSQLYHYRPQIGLDNNLQQLKQKNSTITRVYFYTNPARIEKQFTGKLLINHGFGVIRWENTIIKGYFRVLYDQKKKKSKDIYLVSVNNKDKIAEKKHLKTVSLDGVLFLGQISGKALSKMAFSKI